MKDIIREKLDRIDELYPAKRIALSKKRLTKMWRGETDMDRYPFTYSPITFNYYDDVHTPAQRLEKTLDEIIIHGHLSDDYIPSIFPGCKTSTIPNMLGAREVIMGTDYTAQRIIKSYDDIDELPEPSIKQGTVAHGWLEMQKYMLDMTDGRIPIHVTDMQGPMDVGGQLWGYDNLFISAYENPEYYRKLMDKITKAFIMFWKAQRDLLGDLFVPTHLFGWNWVPENICASISCDSIVMVSPSFFDEFYTPYIETIGRELGDVSLHSCGDFTNVFNNLVDIPCIKAINAGQMSVDDLVEAGLNNDTVAIVYSDMINAKKMFSIIKNNSLRIDLSIDGIWPKYKDKYAQPNEMSLNMWDELKNSNNKIIEHATRCIE